MSEAAAGPMAAQPEARTPDRTNTSPGPRVWRSLDGGLGAVAVLAGSLPLLITAALVAIQRPPTVFDGDFAVDEIFLIRSTHFAQLVGNYSRFGWDHPGPAWFYALDLFYVPLGSQSWAFTAATLALHAIAAGLIVAVAWRIGGPALAAITTLALLAFVAEMGGEVFAIPWPPFAIILPIVLLLLLAALAAGGSLPAAIGALLVGSYEAQLHVGTAAVVGVVLVAMVVIGWVAGGWRAAFRRPRLGQHRLMLPVMVLGLAALVAMWVPVAIDQLTGHPGNLRLLARFFFLSHQPHHRLQDGVSALGRMLAVFPFGHVPPGQEADFSTLPVRRLLIVAGFVGLSAALAVAGALLRDRVAQWLGVLLVITTGVLVWSISRVIGDLYAYFLYWVSAMPLVLLIGWAAIVIKANPGRWLPAPVRPLAIRALGAALALVVVLGAGLESNAFVPPAMNKVRASNSATVAQLTDQVLASAPEQPVLITISTLDAWPTAAGVSLQLVKRGWPVTVRPEYVFMFGGQMQRTHRESLELVFLAVNLNGFDQNAAGVDYLGSATVDCPLRGAACPVYLYSRTPTN